MYLYVFSAKLAHIFCVLFHAWKCITWIFIHKLKMVLLSFFVTCSLASCKVQKNVNVLCSSTTFSCTVWTANRYSSVMCNTYKILYVHFIVFLSKLLWDYTSYITFSVFYYIHIHTHMWIVQLPLSIAIVRWKHSCFDVEQCKTHCSKTMNCYCKFLFIFYYYFLFFSVSECNIIAFYVYTHITFVVFYNASCY